MRSSIDRPPAKLAAMSETTGDFRESIHGSCVSISKSSKLPSKKIKRPMNAFMVWSSVERKKLAEKEPRLHNTELSKRLGHMWKKMTEREKLPFKKEADKLKLKLMEEHPDYKYKPRRRKLKCTTWGNMKVHASGNSSYFSSLSPHIPNIFQPTWGNYSYPSGGHYPFQSSNGHMQLSAAPFCFSSDAKATKHELEGLLFTPLDHTKNDSDRKGGNVSNPACSDKELIFDNDFLLETPPYPHLTSLCTASKHSLAKGCKLKRLHL